MFEDKYYSFHLVINKLCIDKLDKKDMIIVNKIESLFNSILKAYELTDLFNILSYDDIINRLMVGIGYFIESINDNCGKSCYLWLDEPTVISDKKNLDLDSPAHKMIIDKLKYNDDFDNLVIIIFDISIIKKNTPSLIL